MLHAFWNFYSINRIICWKLLFLKPIWNKNNKVIFHNSNLFILQFVFLLKSFWCSFLHTIFLQSSFLKWRYEWSMVRIINVVPNFILWGFSQSPDPHLVCKMAQNHTFPDYLVVFPSLKDVEQIYLKGSFRFVLGPFSFSIFQ